MKTDRDLLALLPAFAFVLLFALVPVAILFVSSMAAAGGASGAARILSDPLNTASVANSLLQGGLSAVFAVAIGYPAGLFFGRYEWPGRGLLRSFLLVPFLLPSLVVVLGVLDLFGPSGLVSSIAPAFAFFGKGVPAIVAANLVFNVPVVVLFTATGAESASSELEETVATLGGGPGRAYLDAWGPPSWVGAAVGGLLTFLFSALSFAPPLLLCGTRCYTVEARVWSLDQVLLQPTAAGVLALAMVGLFLVPTVLYLLLLRQLRAVPSRRPRRPPLPWRQPLGLFLCVVTALVLVAEFGVLAAVLYRSIEPSGGAGAGAAWTALFSLTTQQRLGISAPGMVTNTLAFAGAATIVAILLGVALGYAVVGRPRRASALGLLLFLPLLISPVVLAFALASFWRPLLGGSPNVWILVIVSQAVLAMPFALQSIEIPLAGLSPTGRETARTLGATPWGAFADADLPRVRNGLATAGLFAFALGLGEFTATFFLVTPRFTTLPVALYRLADARAFAIADAAAGLLLILSLVVFALMYAGGRRVEL
jgi:thiamine transport system permease protein